MKNLAATNKEKPLVTKGVPLKFKVPRCQLQLKISNPSYCHPSDENRALSAPASPTKYQSMHDFLTNGSQKQKRTQVGTPGLSPTSASYHGPIIRGQNRIEMKIGHPRPTADKTFTPTAPLKNYNLNGTRLVFKIKDGKHRSTRFSAIYVFMGIKVGYRFRLRSQKLSKPCS